MMATVSVRIITVAIASLVVLAGCKQPSQPRALPKDEKAAAASPPPVVEPPKESDPAFSGECAGLEAYPWPRSYRQILADAPRGSRKLTSSLEGRIVIGPEGNITHLRFLRLSSVDSVNESMISAIRNWHYKPAVLNGKPVSVCTTLSVNVDFSQ